MATEPHGPIGSAQPAPRVAAPAAPVPVEDRRGRLASVLARITLSDDPVLAAEPVSPHVVAEVAHAAVPSSGVAAARVRLVLAAVAGVVGGWIVVGTSPEYKQAPHGWRLTVPGLQPGYSSTGNASLYFGATFAIGIVALGLGWLGLMSYLNRRQGTERSRVKIVVALCALWALPFLLGPVQLSSDAYSYAAQGYMASLGIDPSVYGPTVLPHTTCDATSTICYWSASDAIWRDKPAPYGPVAVALEQGAVMASGSNTYWTVYLLRLLAVAGVVMTGLGVYLIAERRGVSRALAITIAVANPVVLVHLLGGAHNDALMMGLLALGLAAFERSRKVLAVVLITLAVCVKLPAVVALAFLAYNWNGPAADWRDRLRSFGKVGALAAGVIGGLCLLVGIGLGWVTALSSTGTIYSTFAPSTKLGFIASDLLRLVRLDNDSFFVDGIFRLLGLAVAGVILLVMLVRSPKEGVTKAVGMSLLALMLCGPVLWPWYLPVGFTLLTAAGIRKYRPSVIVLIVASSLLVWPTSVNAVDALNPYQHWLGLGVVLLIAGACAVAQYAGRVGEQRLARGCRIPAIEAVLIGPVDDPRRPLAAAVSSASSATPATPAAERR